MKQALVSYSLDETEFHILTLLSRSLRERDISIIPSYGNFDNKDEFLIRSSIKSAILFIGIITNSGKRNHNVYLEWLIARNNNVFNILLVEEGFSFIDPSVRHDPSILIFNRRNPLAQIEEIKRKIEHFKPSINNFDKQALTWLLGGAAAITILNLLSKETAPKKRTKLKKKSIEDSTKTNKYKSYVSKSQKK